MSQPMHDKVWPLRGGQHAHERSVEKLLSVPSTSTLANTDIMEGRTQAESYGSAAEMFAALDGEG